MDLEADLYEQMTREGLKPERWSNGPDYRYPVHDHWYDKIIAVAKGSITFTLNNGSRQQIVTLEAGQRLEIPAHTPHSAVSGSLGVVCLEGRR